MAYVRARARRIAGVLTPSEWARTGGMAATVIALNVAGWGLLAAALGGHYHITKTEIFGVGTGVLASPWACGTPSTPITSRRSTTRRAS